MKTIKNHPLGGSEVQQILDALAFLPRTSTRAVQVVVSLAAAMADAPVNLGGLTVVQSFTVKDLSGAVIPTIKLNGLVESPLSLAKGEVRSDLQITSLFLNCAAGGGSLTLELHGR